MYNHVQILIKTKDSAVSGRVDVGVFIDGDDADAVTALALAMKDSPKLCTIVQLAAVIYEQPKFHDILDGPDSGNIG